MRGLSASRTETNTVPARGRSVPPPIWLLAKAISNERVEAHHLAGRFHLRAEHGVDAGEAREREHRLLDRDDACRSARAEVEAGEAFAGHDARRDLGDRQADHLGDERHGARGARVDLEHVDVAVLDGVLHVHQAADLERQRQRARSAARARRSSSCVERMRRQRAGRVAGMDAGLLDVLHDAGDEDVLAVGQAIDVDLDGVGEIAVDQQRAACPRPPVPTGRSRSAASRAT